MRRAMARRRCAACLRMRAEGHRFFGSTRKEQRRRSGLQRLITLLHRRRVHIHLMPELPEFLRHLRHALLLVVERGGVVAHVLRDLQSGLRSATIASVCTAKSRKPPRYFIKSIGDFIDSEYRCPEVFL